MARDPKFISRRRQKRPFPFDVDSFRRDTRTVLKEDEQLAYIMLLSAMWADVDCRVPDDDRILAQCAGVSQTMWTRRMKVKIMPYLMPHEDGGWTQKRLRRDAYYWERAVASNRSRSGD